MSIVLCIAPHPDDETLGCGGSLLRHKAEGDDIHWLIMTTVEGHKDYSDKQKNERSNQIEEVVKAYGFESFYQCDFLTTELDTIPLNTLIKEVSSHIVKIKPEIIYLPFAGDVHSDHRVVFECVLSSTKSFRHPYIRAIRCYETVSETEFNLDPDIDAFKPNLWVDISDYLEEKLEIMRIYEAEMGHHPFPRSEDNIRALAQFRGSTANFKNAEAFLSLKQLI